MLKRILSVFVLLVIFPFTTFAEEEKSELDFSSPTLTPKIEETKTLAEMVQFSGDFRTIGFLSERPLKQGKQGLAIMTSVVGVNVSPVESISTKLSYDLGLLNPGVRNAYVEFQFPNQNLFQHLRIGRFNAPFGITTPDHRLFIKQFIGGGNHNVFETGLETHGAIRRPLTYDLSLVHGNGTGDKFLSKEMSVALIPRIEMEWLQGFVAGVSGYYFQRFRDKSIILAQGAASPPPMNAILGAHSTGVLGKLELFLETQIGIKKNQDNPMLSQLVRDKDFSKGIKGGISLGYFAQARYQLLSNISSFYTLEQIAFDFRYWGDAFTRHTFGTEWRLFDFSSIEARVEMNLEGRKVPPDLSHANNAALLMLHAWF